MVSPTSRSGRARGDIARQRIVCYLLQQRDQGTPNVIIDDLCEALGMAKTTVRHHVAWLEQQSVVSIIDVPSRKLAQAVHVLEPVKRPSAAS